MADTIKTTIHAYCFDISKPDGKVAWLDLKARLKETHPHCMESHGGQGHYHFVRDLDGQEIDLETAHLFDNQESSARRSSDLTAALQHGTWAERAQELRAYISERREL